MVGNCQLIVFTRYPEPGKTKTRLIPLLGAHGAAMLQRQMTEYVLQQVGTQSVVICYSGGDRELMQDWLGEELTYQPQSEGDLGRRMYCAFETAFAAGVRKVAIIGTDCPDIDANIVSESFAALDRNDVVLGPAADGGYYLIGLNRSIPELFVGIDWGTSEVLAQTKSIAEKLRLNVRYLPIFNDIDRPEDAIVWLQKQSSVNS